MAPGLHCDPDKQTATEVPEVNRFQCPYGMGFSPFLLPPASESFHFSSAIASPFPSFCIFSPSLGLLLALALLPVFIFS